MDDGSEVCPSYNVFEKYAYSPAGLLPKDTVTFFRYEGSLTTPPCTEGVVWTILVQPRYVSENELNFLRQHITTEGELLRYNWRPTQPLNNRTIYLNRILLVEEYGPSELIKSKLIRHSYPGLMNTLLYEVKLAEQSSK
ncbi:hypothetical protein ANCDUO_03875 [Ancylostoma duodenale]|uniref:carbonic anhydrase n=1 Tax=Ancylostoma duodenale TaxID=51022 RepID=A0A0C2H2M6_9BILA|nr:hypothetical protein ANCDUO_03875 [Ancylostoma duodenale]